MCDAVHSRQPPSWCLNTQRGLRCLGFESDPACECLTCAKQLTSLRSGSGRSLLVKGINMSCVCTRPDGNDAFLFRLYLSISSLNSGKNTTRAEAPRKAPVAYEASRCNNSQSGCSTSRRVSPRSQLGSRIFVSSRDSLPSGVGTAACRGCRRPPWRTWSSATAAGRRIMLPPRKARHGS